MQIRKEWDSKNMEQLIFNVFQLLKDRYILINSMKKIPKRNMKLVKSEQTNIFNRRD